MATIATPVTNPFHIEYIQENQVFTVTEYLGLTTCGICSIVDVLTVVDAESPVVTAHGYAGSTNCLTIALCPDATRPTRTLSMRRSFKDATCVAHQPT